jgi:hypothetical protein
MATRELAVLSLLLGVVSSALAEPLDPSLPQRRVVGAPAGANPMFRGDGARTGRATAAFPDSPRVLWRARITGGLDLPMAVDERGHVIAASPMGHVTELRADGKLAWTAKLPAGSPPTIAPVITSDGTRVVVTGSGDIIGLTSAGRDKFQSPLPFGRSAKGLAPALAASDGGVVLGGKGALAWLDASGTVAARAAISGTPVSLIERRSRVLAVTERGDVFEWRPPGEPTKLGSFAGRVDEGAALSGPKTVTAVVDHLRLVDLDLETGARTVRVESLEMLQGPPAVLANGETRVASFGGTMLGHDRAGVETARAALEPPGGALGAPPLAFAPPLWVDPSGRVAYARPGLDVGVLLPSGEPRAAAGAACGDPIALVPAGPQRLVLACRSGLVLMIGP